MATYQHMLESLPELEGHWESAHEAEWEDELSHEYEDEFMYEDELTPEFEGEYEGEGFLGTLTRGGGGLFGAGELEGELSYEYEDELSHELSHEFSHEAGYEMAHEGEAEAEAFFGKLAEVAQRAVTPPALQELGRSAARSAMRAGLSGAAAPQKAVENTIGLLAEAEILSELTHEMAQEQGWAGEGELNPIRRVYPDAMMEHLGYAAAEAETEGEAFAFLAPLIPLAMKALPLALKAAPKVFRIGTKIAPRLFRGVRGIARTLMRNRRTRPLIRTLPTIVRRTTNTIARQAAQGQNVTPQAAVRALAQQAARAIGDPQQAVQIYRRARALDQQYHNRSAAVANGAGLSTPAAEGLGGVSDAMPIDTGMGSDGVMGAGPGPGTMPTSPTTGTGGCTCTCPNCGTKVN